jgi:hypothetical protein
MSTYRDLELRSPIGPRLDEVLAADALQFVAERSSPTPAVLTVPDQDRAAALVKKSRRPFSARG